MLRGARPQVIADLPPVDLAHDATIAELDPADQALVLSFIDALVTKTRLKRLTAQIS